MTTARTANAAAIAVATMIKFVVFFIFHFFFGFVCLFSVSKIAIAVVITVSGFNDMLSILCSTRPAQTRDSRSAPARRISARRTNSTSEEKKP
jgi:hypothetical protein